MRRMLSLALSLVLLALLALPLPTSSQTSGSASYYGRGYGYAEWCSIMQQQIAWGNGVPGAVCPDNGYFCVHPAYAVGEILALSANGREITCTIGDTVRPEHVTDWYEDWVIELSWSAFVDLGLQDNNHVTVWGVAGYPAEPEPAPEPAPIIPTSECFPTGYCIQLGFYDYWRANGGVRIFGYPLTNEFIATDTGLTTQVFERTVLEFDPAAGDWAIRGRHIAMPDYVPAEAR